VRGVAVTALAPLLGALVAACGGAAQQPSRTVVQERTATHTVVQQRTTTRTQTVTVPARAPQSAPTADASPRYLAQLGSFRLRADADRFAADLGARGLHAAVLRSDAYVEMQPGYWVVYLGFFEDLGAAEAAATRANASGKHDAFARQVTYDVTR
jgi:cell division protein FtsN